MIAPSTTGWRRRYFSPANTRESALASSFAPAPTLGLRIESIAVATSGETTMQAANGAHGPAR